MSFFESSDLFEAKVVLDLMPESYLTKEKALLLAKSKLYKEALDLCLQQLSDPDYATFVAQRAYQWHEDKHIYFLLFAKLLQAGERGQAMKLLAKTSPLILSCEKVTSHLNDEEVFDSEMQDYYRKAIVEMEQIGKELKILRGMTAQKYLQTAEELMRIKCLDHVIITEDTVCHTCGKKIGCYSFCYLYSLKRVLHQYCHHPDTLATVDPHSLVLVSQFQETRK